MRKEAELSGVPIFRNVPLARLLYAEAGHNDYVPDEVFDVVAEILAWVARNQATLYDGPIVALVNRGTASASEILAGALQDNSRAALLGDRTYGKGLIQTLTNLSDGSGLAVTVAGYVTPSGRDIQGEGIAPDRQLSDPEPLNPGGEGDRWLTEAEQWMVALLEQDPSDSNA